MWYKVIWDTKIDGDILDPRDLDLPEQVEVPDEIEDVSNWISDNYGWCTLQCFQVSDTE